MRRFPSAALLLLVAAAAAAVAAPLTDAQLDEIEHGILPLRHGYDRNDALAAFARQEGATRDDMSTGLVAIVERRTPETNRVDAVREFAIAALGVFGGTNALPALRRIALDTDDPDGLHAIYAYGRLAGYAPEAFAWAEPFLFDVRPEGSKRRAEFLNVFRHSLVRDDLAPPRSRTTPPRGPTKRSAGPSRTTPATPSAAPAWKRPSPGFLRPRRSGRIPRPTGSPSSAPPSPTPSQPPSPLTPPPSRFRTPAPPRPSRASFRTNSSSPKSRRNGENDLYLTKLNNHNKHQTQ